MCWKSGTAFLLQLSTFMISVKANACIDHERRPSDAAASKLLALTKTLPK